MKNVRFSIVTRIVAVSGVSLGLFATAILVVVRRTVERAVYEEIDARVQVAQKTLWDLTRNKGVASLKDGKLQFGSAIVEGDHEIVDHLKELTGADASIFQMMHGHLIRVSTTVESADASGRNVGTELSGAALAAFRLGNSYAGINPVAGKDFVVRYDALRDADGHVVGMLFTGIPLAAMRSATDATMRIVMIGTPIALALSLGLLYLITRPLHRTIRRAVDVAQGLARGDVDQTTGRASNDEFGEVNVAFNDIIAYHQRMVYLADAIAGGNLAVDVVPNSQNDRLGVAFARMTQNLRDLVTELELTAVTDKLTQIGNRRAFDDRLLRELSRASRHSEPLALAFIDVDCFKRINDQHGHHAGDDVLMKLGKILKDVRLEDHSFRLGGDEFAVIMPNTTVSQAKVLAERIRHAAGDALPVTLSIGIADTNDGVYDAQALRCNADAALYAGKEMGRDRIVGYDFAFAKNGKLSELAASHEPSATVLDGNAALHSAHASANQPREDNRRGAKGP